MPNAKKSAPSSSAKRAEPRWRRRPERRPEEIADAGAAVPAVRARFLREGPHRGWKVLGALIRAGQARGEFGAGIDADSAAKLIACGLVLQIMLECLGGTKPRARRTEFDREFAQ